MRQSPIGGEDRRPSPRIESEEQTTGAGVQSCGSKRLVVMDNPSTSQNRTPDPVGVRLLLRDTKEVFVDDFRRARTTLPAQAQYVVFCLKRAGGHLDDHDL